MISPQEAMWALGDHQEVGGRLGVNVIEGIDLVILVDLGGGDFSPAILPEQTIAHVVDTPFCLNWLKVLRDHREKLQRKRSRILKAVGMAFGAVVAGPRGPGGS